jgi:hypothetical protein
MVAVTALVAAIADVVGAVEFRLPDFFSGMPNRNGVGLFIGRIWLMFGLFKKRSLSEQELSERAVSCLGELLVKHGPVDFKAMVETGYLGFNSNGVYYCADFDLMVKVQRDTICYVKLSDISMLKKVRPAVVSNSPPMGEYVPQEILFAGIEISKSVKPLKG